MRETKITKKDLLKLTARLSDVDDDLDLTSVLFSYLEEASQYREWAKKIPYIKWPSDWEVKAVPPSGGAMVRYRVQKPDGKIASIYLDCYERLGFMGRPYWEVYPVNGTTFRCALHEVDELLKAIGLAG